MNVSESIKSAWAAVEESGVPEHMQELAFREALRAVLGTSETAAVTAPRVVPPHRPTPKVDGDEAKSGSGPDDNGATPSPSEDAVIAAVSEDTGVPAEKLEKVFHIDGGVVN